MLPGVKAGRQTSPLLDNIYGSMDHYCPLQRTHSKGQRSISGEQAASKMLGNWSPADLTSVMRQSFLGSRAQVVVDRGVLDAPIYCTRHTLYVMLIQSHSDRLYYLWSYKLVCGLKLVWSHQVMNPPTLQHIKFLRQPDRNNCWQSPQFSHLHFLPITFQGRWRSWSVLTRFLHCL